MKTVISNTLLKTASKSFLDAAKKEGLKNPLTGLDDPRVENPDQLVKNEGWMVANNMLTRIGYCYAPPNMGYAYFEKDKDGRSKPTQVLIFINGNKEIRLMTYDRGEYPTPCETIIQKHSLWSKEKIENSVDTVYDAVD